LSPSSSQLRNIPASVRQRLLNLAHQRGEDFQFVLNRFACERILYRLSNSRYRGRFLLKGAMLLPVWSEEAYRLTRDLDLAGVDEISPERVATIFRDLCQVQCREDGLSFDSESIRVNRIREAQQEGGLRVEMRASLAVALIPLQIDIGFGDAVTPEASEVEYPTLLGHPAPRLKAYPRETVVAEKFQAMVYLGIANTRMKDFYDLWSLARGFHFAGPVLARAIEATFQRRRTQVPEADPIALTPEFSLDSGKQAAWRAFLRRTARTTGLLGLFETCTLLRGFLMPPSRAIARGEPFEDTWSAPGPWL